MTHRIEVVRRCLDLNAEGLTVTAIARITGVPRRTVSDWVRGRTPVRRPKKACSRCSRAHAPLAELGPSYVYLLGLYLGDGYIAEHPRAFRLRIFLDARYPKIIAQAAQAMRDVAPANRVGLLPRPKGDVEVSAYSKAWPCLFPQYGRGKKHERSIELEGWQTDLVRLHPESLLRGLIHSDGCRFTNTGRAWQHPRYAFSNLSSDIRRIFTDACDLLGLRWTVARNTIYVSRKADVALMDEFIGPKA